MTSKASSSPRAGESLVVREKHSPGHVNVVNVAKGSWCLRMISPGLLQEIPLPE